MLDNTIITYGKEITIWYTTGVVTFGYGIDCLALVGDKSPTSLVSGCKDYTLKVWNLTTKACEKTIDNEGPITTITVVDDLIITGSMCIGGKLRAYKQYEKLFEVPCYEISKVLLTSDTIIFTSNNIIRGEYLIHIITFEGVYKATLQGHTDVITNLLLLPGGSRQLISISRDKTLRVWDMFECKKIQSIGTQGILSNKRLITTYESILQIWK